LDGLVTENLGIFYDHLVYFTAIGNILWPFRIFWDNLVYFFPVLVFWTMKNLATLLKVVAPTLKVVSRFDVEFQHVD
jgi:hypothetical protein